MIRRFGLLMGIGKMRKPLTCSLLNLFCFLIVIPIYLLVLSDSHALQEDEKVVAQSKVHVPLTTTRYCSFLYALTAPSFSLKIS